MMKVMLVIQRVLAVLVGMYGFVLMFSEAELTAGIIEQLQPFVSGLALMVVSFGWLVLTGLEEDWFVNKSRKNRK